MTDIDRMQAQIDQQSRRILELECQLAKAETRNAKLQRMRDHAQRHIAKLEARLSPQAQAERVFLK